MGWMLRKQSLHHVVESGPRGKKVYCVAQRRQKWNNKLDSSTQHNYAKQMWRPKQLNNLCNTSGAAQPISLLYSAFPSFKELIAEHFSFFSAQPKPSLALHLFLVYKCNVSGWLESITYRSWCRTLLSPSWNIGADFTFSATTIFLFSPSFESSNRMPKILNYRATLYKITKKFGHQNFAS